MKCLIKFMLTLLAMNNASHIASAATIQQVNTFIASGDQCMTHQLDRYIWVRGKDVEWINRPFEERYRTASKIYEAQRQSGNGFKTLFNGPWDRSLVPVLTAQRDAIFDALLTNDTSGTLLNGIEYDANGSLLRLEELETYLHQNVSRNFPNMIQTIATQFGGKRRKLNELLNPPPQKDYEERIKQVAEISAACIQIGAVPITSCVSAVKTLIAEANYNANMILPHIWNDFIRTKILREGVRKGAIIMLERVKSGMPGQFFIDLVKGFELAGLPKDKAVEAAWRLLALYGNGGANTGYRLLAIELPAEAEVFAIALSFISTTVTYLDFQQRMSGQHHYALPPEVTGGCLTAKPYHFWLNAYFSRWLVKQGYTPSIAQTAAFILNKGYQVNRDVNNAGGGIEKLLSKPAEHPTNRVIRADLNLGAAGNIYGSLVNKQRMKPIDIGEGLSQLHLTRGDSALLSERSILDRLSSDRIQFIRKWDELYKPNRALLFYQKQQQ